MPAIILPFPTPPEQDLATSYDCPICQQSVTRFEYQLPAWQVTRIHLDAFGNPNCDKPYLSPLSTQGVITCAHCGSLVSDSRIISAIREVMDETPIVTRLG